MAVASGVAAAEAASVDSGTGGRDGDGADWTQDSNFALGGPASYLVAQGVCFFKRSLDPRHDQITKATRRTGRVLNATGAIWRGQHGRVWAELAELFEPEGQDNSGWALVEGGAAFGWPGPLLIPQHPEDGEGSADSSTIIRVKYGMDTILECLLPSSADVAQLLVTLSRRTGLAARRIILNKTLPSSDLPMFQGYSLEGEVLQMDMRLGEVDNGLPLLLTYCGNFDEDYRPFDVEGDDPVLRRKKLAEEIREQEEEARAAEAAERRQEEAEQRMRRSSADPDIGGVAASAAAERAAARRRVQAQLQQMRLTQQLPQQVALDARARQVQLQGDGKRTCMVCGALATTKEAQADHLRSAGHDGFYMSG